jgi:LPS-assembly lipoprotein
MYAKGGSGADKSGINGDLAGIRVLPIRDRMGQKLRNSLVQRLTPQGEPGDYRYTLTVELTESASDMGYRRDTFATMGKLIMTASISLIGDGMGILAGSANTEVSFDYLGPRYASVAMERDAEDRAVTQIAEDIRGQVAAAILRYKANPKDPKFRKVAEEGFLLPDAESRSERR